MRHAAKKGGIAILLFATAAFAEVGFERPSGLTRAPAGPGLPERILGAGPGFRGRVPGPVLPAAPTGVGVPRRGDSAAKADALLARFAHEPSVRAVQEAAARWVGADPARLESWRSRVRKAPWLPQIRTRVVRGFEDDLLTNASGQTRVVDDDLTVEVRLQWDLDRLVFDRAELQVSRESALLAELRQDVVAEATRLYFQRRRLQVDQILDPLPVGRARVERELRLAELTALLDGLTGGFFSRALRRRR
jgi:hypothetical protein